MFGRIARRVGVGVALVLAVVTITFLLINLAPGDPARLWTGPGASPADLAAARRALDLDAPLVVRYVRWVAAFARGDWGTSLAQQRPVTAVLAGAVPATLVLSGASLILTYLGGIAVGAWQAARRRTAWDTGVSIVNLIVLGMPAYWVAVMLVLVFAYAAARFGWPGWIQLPAMGVSSLDAEFLTPWGQVLDRARHLVLPLATLAGLGIAGTARFVRGSVIDAADAAYVRAARARGLRPGRVQRRYVIRNALLPVITLAGLSFPALFSGTVFVEVIFAWPGMGREIVGAVAARDYPVVLAATAIFAALVVAGNLLADVAYGWVDPRWRRDAA